MPKPDHSFQSSVTPIPPQLRLRFVAHASAESTESLSVDWVELKFELCGFRRRLGPVQAIRGQGVEDGSFKHLKSRPKPSNEILAWNRGEGSFPPKLLLYSTNLTKLVRVC